MNCEICTNKRICRFNQESSHLKELEAIYSKKFNNMQQPFKMNITCECFVESTNMFIRGSNNVGSDSAGDAESASRSISTDGYAMGKSRAIVNNQDPSR